MPKRKEPELTPEEQYRFRAAANAAGVIKDEEEFRRAFKMVAKPEKPKVKSGFFAKNRSVHTANSSMSHRIGAERS